MHHVIYRTTGPYIVIYVCESRDYSTALSVTISHMMSYTRMYYNEHVLIRVTVRLSSHARERMIIVTITG